MTVPENRSASASASADLPLAVGPAMSTAQTIHSLRATHSMSHIATLISNPKNLAVTRKAAQAAKALLPGAGDIATLDGEIASEIPFALPAGSPTRALADTLRAALGAVDVVIQPAANRKKRLFVADMDST